MKNYLTTNPPTRVNDSFLKENTTIRCTLPVSNYKDSIIQGPPKFDYQDNFYQKIGVDIVTETTFDYPYPFITEKTYRPIALLRPFIMLGPVYTLRFLKQHGFKTFSSIIDESYDSIKDPEKRFISVCYSIEEFVKKPLDQIRQELYNIEDVLLHNQKCLYDLTNSELKKFKQILDDSN